MAAVHVPAAEAVVAASGPVCSWAIFWGPAGEEAVGVHPHPHPVDSVLVLLEAEEDSAGLAVSTAVEAAASAAEDSAEAAVASMVEAAAVAAEPADKEI